MCVQYNGSALRANPACVGVDPSQARITPNTALFTITEVGITNHLIYTLVYNFFWPESETAIIYSEI
jgi:hypothetical protein